MIRSILEKYKRGEINLEEAERELKLFCFHEIKDFGKLDLQRENRVGIPEIILGEGKKVEELCEICEEMLKNKGRCIITKLDSEKLKKVKEKFENFISKEYERSGILVLKNKEFKTQKNRGKIAIITAGTADIPVAEEAKAIAEEMGCEVYTFYDVGVAGVHRLLRAIEEIIKEDVDVVIVAAGREGALPSVVAGLIDIPVIGLPTSVGYGIGGKGKASLYAMLQSCSLGMAVVNIDNGVGAGAFAGLIANRIAKFRLNS